MVINVVIGLTVAQRMRVFVLRVARFFCGLILFERSINYARVRGGSGNLHGYNHKAVNYNDSFMTIFYFAKRPISLAIN